MRPPKRGPWTVCGRSQTGFDHASRRCQRRVFLGANSLAKRPTTTSRTSPRPSFLSFSPTSDLYLGRLPSPHSWISRHATLHIEALRLQLRDHPVGVAGSRRRAQAAALGSTSLTTGRTGQGRPVRLARLAQGRWSRESWNTNRQSNRRTNGETTRTG